MKQPALMRPELVFAGDPEVLIDIYRQKWIFNDVQVKIGNRPLIPVFFATLGRVQQELDDPSVPAFAEKNLIIVREISLAAMVAATEDAWQGGMFDDDTDTMAPVLEDEGCGSADPLCG